MLGGNLVGYDSDNHTIIVGGDVMINSYDEDKAHEEWEKVNRPLVWLEYKRKELARLQAEIVEVERRIYGKDR